MKNGTKKGYDDAVVGDSINLAYPDSKTRRGRVGHRVAQTLDTACNQGVVVKAILDGDKWDKMHDISRRVYSTEGIAPTIHTMCGGKTEPKIYDEYELRIRRLTPKECWRLMGFFDEDFEKAEKENSNSQLYKQAGNSIVVQVLERIFEEML